MSVIQSFGHLSTLYSWMVARGTSITAILIISQVSIVWYIVYRKHHNQQECLLPSSPPFIIPQQRSPAVLELSAVTEDTVRQCSA